MPNIKANFKKLYGKISFGSFKTCFYLHEMLYIGRKEEKSVEYRKKVTVCVLNLDLH